MKKFILASIITALALTASAQKTGSLKFGAGAEIGVVTGNLNDAYSSLIGGTLQADFSLLSNATITGNTGVLIFLGKDIKNTNLRYKSAAFIPLLAGVKFYFTPNVYGSGQLGVTFSSQSGGGSSFTYAPGIGYKLNKYLDILLKYTGYSGSGGNLGVKTWNKFLINSSVCNDATEFLSYDLINNDRWSNHHWHILNKEPAVLQRVLYL